MAPHEFAEALHRAAVTLENDSWLYQRLPRLADRQEQRNLIWDRLRVLDPALRAALQDHNGVVAVEQLRRYLVDVWDVTTDNEQRCYYSYREQADIKFWEASVREPPKKAPKPAPKPAPSFNDLNFTAAEDRVAAALSEEIDNHLATAAGHFQSLADKLTSLTPKETTMSKIIDIKTKTFVNGIDVTTLTNAQVFDLIAEQEAAIQMLASIEAKPKLLVKEIEERKAGIAALVAHLDAKAE